MTASDYIIDVSEADFEYQVIAYSQQMPVIVDFWATWCIPCKTLGPMLERMALEARGTFRLARVDVDQNPNLAGRFQVRSIPTVKAFKDGKIVSEFTGAIPEPRLREFVQAFAPAHSDLMLEKGFSLLRLAQPKSAEKAFREVLDEAPENTKALLGLAKSLLLQGELSESRHILANFPASKEYNSAQPLSNLAEVLYRAQADGFDYDLSETDPLSAAYHNAMRLVGIGNLPAALDGLLDILRQDKRYQNGEARTVFLAILELMGEDDPATRQYRSELASVLF